DNADQELLWDGSDATVDQWHQVGITFADGEVTLYVDGLAVVSTALRTALASPLHPLSIGVDPGTTRILFGALDEVRFSDDPWSANRFEADYATVAQNFVAFGT